MAEEHPHDELFAIRKRIQALQQQNLILLRETQILTQAFIAHSPPCPDTPESEETTRKLKRECEFKDRYINELENMLRMTRQELEEERKKRLDQRRIIPQHELRLSLKSLRPKEITEWWLAARGLN